MKYLLIMIIPLTVLLSRPIIPLMTLAFGQEVKLSTVPFDPRDFFRGDYVELSFEIEEVNYDMFSQSLKSKDLQLIEKKEFHNKRYRNDEYIKVYVSLKPDDAGIYYAALVSDSRPADDIYVRGKIKNSNNRRGLRINYGNNLSRFYVKENTGLELENAARKGQVQALAKIWNGFIVLDTLVMIPEK
jgi:uncharacterized membrane-anchored protein